MLIEIVVGVCLLVVAAVFYSCEREAERLQSQANRWREAYWESLNLIAKGTEQASLRSALRKSQERIEELQDEIDELRESRVCPASVGCGGKC